MKFLVTPNTYWDTNKEIQSEAAQKWLQNIRTTNADKVEKDNFGRPFRWTWNTEYATLTVEHTFVYPNSTNWSVDKIIINVNKK